VTIYTIGHSTRPAEAFAELLVLHGIRQIADVRTVPRSRRHPHFGRETLDAFLAAHGIAYLHIPELGGLRKPRADSANTAWRHPSFRGYADYMDTPTFQLGVESLLRFAQSGRTAVMCAEAVWWQCHRRLLADALVVRGAQVFHVLSAADPKPHELSEFAHVRGTSVIYPGLL
jgi:uncharacterized protein (DUF488 family)